MGRFSKLPYLGMKLILEVADTLSLPHGSEIELIFDLRAVVSEIFKIAIIGHETWPFAKVPTVAHIPSFYPKGAKGGLSTPRGPSLF